MPDTAAHELSPTPSLVRRLMPGLALLVAIPLCTALALLWQQHQRRMHELITGDAEEMGRDLNLILSLQGAGLATAIRPIAADAGVQRALAEGDAQALRAWLPVFADMRRENHVTHLYFSDRERMCLLRAHAPEQRGDRIDRCTTVTAERTGRTAQGLEIGPRGTLTLRVVEPVFAQGRRVGYVELGVEIEDVLRTLGRHMSAWNQMAVVVHKELVERRAWEATQRELGREAAWERMPHHVVLLSSQGRLPDVFAAWLDPASPGQPPVRDSGEVVADGATWRVMDTPLQDASGAVIGDLLAMRDITTERHALLMQLVIGGSVGLLAVVAVLAFVHRLLRRSDGIIGAQQADLRNKRWRLASIIEATRAGTWEWDIATGTVAVSERWAQILGYTCLELGPMDRARWEGLLHPDDLAAARTLVERNFTRALPFLDHECRLRHRDGRWVWIHCRGRIFTRDAGGRPLLMFGTHSDISARKESEAERERLLRQQQASELAELMQSNRLVALGTLMAGLAHEFNHPAQVVLLNQRSLRTIVEACVAAAKDREGQAVGLLTWNEVATVAPTLLDDMESATTYLQELIENVRGYAGARDDAGDAIDAAVLAAVAAASLRLVASYARRRQVALSSPLLGVHPPAGGGSGRLQQVVVNLLINAVQATPPGGTVTLELVTGDGADQVVIRDDGAGIDPAVIDRLGRPFVTTRSASGGTGLGLYISHHLVTRLGGTLVLAPRRPRGTVATISFPPPPPA